MANVWFISEPESGEKVKTMAATNNQLTHKESFVLFEWLRDNQERFTQEGSTIDEAAQQASKAMGRLITPGNISSKMRYSDAAPIKHKWRTRRDSVVSSELAKAVEELQRLDERVHECELGGDRHAKGIGSLNSELSHHSARFGRLETELKSATSALARALNVVIGVIDKQTADIEARKAIELCFSIIKPYTLAK